MENQQPQALCDRFFVQYCDACLLSIERHQTRSQQKAAGFSAHPSTRACAASKISPVLLLVLPAQTPRLKYNQAAPREFPPKLTHQSPAWKTQALWSNEPQACILGFKEVHFVQRMAALSSRAWITQAKRMEGVFNWQKHLPKDCSRHIQRRLASEQARCSYHTPQRVKKSPLQEGVCKNTR